MFNDLYKAIQEAAQLILKPIQALSQAQADAIQRVYELLFGKKRFDIESIREDIKRNNKTIDDKIQEAQQSLQNTQSVINELNQVITEHQDELMEVRKEYERLTKLNELSFEQAEPLIKEVNKSVNKGNTKNYIVSFLISLFFFLVGGIFGPFLYNLFFG